MMGLTNQNTIPMIQMVISDSLPSSFLNSKCLYFFLNIFFPYSLWWFSAEDNPLNDYPDEISEDEEEVVSEASENESEEKESESESNMSLKSEDLDQHGLLDDAELSGNESEKESESENNRSLKPEDLDQHDVLDDAELSHDTEIDDHYNYRGDDFDYPYGDDDEEWRWVNEH
jgi:hypothetical protein